LRINIGAGAEDIEAALILGAKDTGPRCPGRKEGLGKNMLMVARPLVVGFDIFGVF
jgi:hypothetical protein